MPYDSLEVLWFFNGPLTDVSTEIESWFKSEWPHETSRECDPLLWPQDWRKDYYAILPGAGTMGIKRREGRLEIKGRVRDFGVLSFADHVHGRTERWMKWS